MSTTCPEPPPLPEHDAFAAVQGETFTVRVGDATTTLMLAEVEALSPAPYPGGVRIPFSLTFRGEPGVALAQHGYRLEHPTLGDHDIFIVPIAREGQTMLYQAVFN